MIAELSQVQGHLVHGQTPPLVVWTPIFLFFGLPQVFISSFESFERSDQVNSQESTTLSPSTVLNPLAALAFNISHSEDSPVELGVSSLEDSVHFLARADPRAPSARGGCSAAKAG